MRILLITDNHTPSGGAENYFFDLKQRLKNTSDISVYSLGFGSKEIQGDDFYILKGLKSKTRKLIWQILFHPVVFLKLRNHIKKINPDIIHIHNVKHYTVSLLKALKGYPVVQTIHDYSVICPIAQNLHLNKMPCKTGLKLTCFWQHQIKYNKLIYLALIFSFYQLKIQLKKSVTQFIAPSPLLADYLKNNCFAPVHYIPPFKPDKNPCLTNKVNTQHFLFAGNLGQHKGLSILLNEFFLALKINPKLTLTLAGKGDEEKNIKNKIKALNLEKHVFLIGWKTQSELENEYAKCAALIFPSLGFEAFGLVITEAMHHAKPVIAANRSTSPWLIDNEKTGFIFNPLKTGDLAEKILTLAGNMTLITQLGKNGQAKLHQLIDNEKTLNQLLQLYKEIVKTNSIKK